MGCEVILRCVWLSERNLARFHPAINLIFLQREGERKEGGRKGEKREEGGKERDFDQRSTFLSCSLERSKEPISTCLRVHSMAHTNIPLFCPMIGESGKYPQPKSVGPQHSHRNY